MEQQVRIELRYSFAKKNCFNNYLLNETLASELNFSQETKK